MNSIKVVELFAGIGGFRYGLEKSRNNNFQVVWSNQWEPRTKAQHASDIYVQRFGSTNHFNEDINKIEIPDIPDHDLLVAGFPCQDYSVAKRLYEAKGLEGNQGRLWFRIEEILKKKKPKMILLENVDRLLKSPAGAKGKDFYQILNFLNSAGYAVEWRVINAAEYGMPQRRKRIFMFGARMDKRYKNEACDILQTVGVFAKAFPVKKISKEDVCNFRIDAKSFHGDKIFFNSGILMNGKVNTVTTYPKFSGKRKVLKDVLLDLSKIPKDFILDKESIEKWRAMKSGKREERKDRNNNTYIYAEGAMCFPDSIEKPSRTIVTGEGGKSPSRFKHVVKQDNIYRRLTPVELEKLSMFPTNFTKIENITPTKRAFLLGNAVITGTITRIGNQI